MKRVSRKRSGWLAKYRDAKSNYPRPLVCWVTGRVINEEADNWSFHHPYGRGTLENLLTFHPVLHEWHEWIHANANEAREKGFLFF